MKLSHTQTLVQKKIDERYMDACAIVVSLRGEKAAVFSKNVNVDTLFDIASMGKVLVTTPLILKAVGENRLSLNDTLGELFDDVPADKRCITVRQLLTHTSGILRYEFPAEVGRAGHGAVLRWILDSKLGYEPGTQYVYSCNGMMTLGFILEKLYGKELDEIWAEQLKAPMGLTRSAFNVPLDFENVADSYHWKDPQGIRLDDVNVRCIGGVSGAGGMFFTARDISAYCEAVMAKSPLLYPEPLFAEAEKDYTPDQSEGRGLGWLITDDRYPQTGKLFPKGSFGHVGWTGTSVFMNRELDLYAIVLTNSMRWTYVREDFTTINPDPHTHKLREALHDEILRDLKEQKLL